MSYENPDALVDTAWVAEHLDDPQVRIVDGSWHLPPTGRDGAAEYQASHIPGAVHFDIDAISDQSSPLPHMLPDADAFGEVVGAMGIGNEHRVIVYDADSLFSAPRVWWMFRAFGHDDVAVMAGGFRAWTAEGRPTTDEIPAREPQTFHAVLRAHMVRAIDQVRRAIDDGSELVLDARAADRFDGSQPEFREGVEPGHIPGSANLPYAQIVDAEAGTFHDAETLRRAFEAAGVDGTRPVTTTCGSGVTASILGLGLYLTGKENWAVYDGSWTEWGSSPDTPKEKGPA